MRSVAAHQPQKGYYLWRYTDSAATATKHIFDGARSYVDPFAASGICIDRNTGELWWGAALVGGAARRAEPQSAAAPRLDRTASTASRSAGLTCWPSSRWAPATRSARATTKLR